MVVVEAVYDSPRDAQHLARTDLGLFSVDRPSQHALKPVDRLLVTVVAVKGRMRDEELDKALAELEEMRAVAERELEALENCR